MNGHLSTTMGRVRGLLNRNKLLSASMLAIVLNIPQIRLSAALRGAMYLGAEEESRVWTVANRCVEVLEAILPLTIASGDGHTLKLLVENGRDVEEVRSIAMLLLEPSHEELSESVSQ